MKLENDDFDIAEFMKNYDAKKRKDDSSSNNNKPKDLTLADLMNKRSSRTFIKDDD